MNILVLDTDIERCAHYHCDQHVVKMILESVQLMCTALNKKGFSTPYKSTHSQHPCVLRVEQSWQNFCWLGDLTRALNAEYRYRFDKTVDHKRLAVLEAISAHRFEDHGLTELAQAMPDQYKIVGDPVRAYHQFDAGDKLHFAPWIQRSTIATSAMEYRRTSSAPGAICEESCSWVSPALNIKLHGRLDRLLYTG